VNAPPLYSLSNGQVERFHSALAEIARCLKLDKKTNIKARLVKAQQDNIERCNPTRQNRISEVGEQVFVKNNKRLGNKLTPLCTEQKMQADLGTSVLIKGRVVHKDNLK